MNEQDRLCKGCKIAGAGSYLRPLDCTPCCASRRDPQDQVSLRGADDHLNGDSSEPHLSPAYSMLLYGVSRVEWVPLEGEQLTLF